MNTNWYRSISKSDIDNELNRFDEIKKAFDWISMTDKDIIISALDWFSKSFLPKIEEVLDRIWNDKATELTQTLEWLSSKEVKKILVSWNWLRKIQEVKEDIVSRIFKSIDSKDWYKIDSREISVMDSMYYDIINQVSFKNLKNKDRYISWLQKDIQLMYKTNSSYIESWESPFSRWYLWDFEKKKSILHQYIWSSNAMLKKSLWDSLVSWSEKDNIRDFMNLTRQVNIPNTRQKNIWVDVEVLSWLISKFETMNNSLEAKKAEIKEYEELLKNEDLENRGVIENKLAWAKAAIKWMRLVAKTHKEKVRNEKCFYETDLEWNKNYFSYNTLINYIDTFGLEVWLPHVNLDWLSDEIKKYFFPSIDRVLKKHMSVTILEQLRDKQEIIINWLTDYKLNKNDRSEYQAGFIAEKVVELEFRELADLSEYNVKISKPSVWEDMINKVDLFLELEDKKTGIKIQTELQITIKDDLSLKRQQIAKRNKALQNQKEYTDSKLIDFTMKDLWRKLSFWQAHNRPIWSLSDVLDDIEKTTIRDTFKRLVSNLEAKSKKVSEKKD